VVPPQLKEGPQIINDDDVDDDDNDNNNNNNNNKDKSRNAAQQHMRFRKFVAMRHRPIAQGYTTFSPKLEATSVKI
jgi:hypothetical protein